MEINILYEDNHLLVAVKPPEVPVQADSSGADDFLGMLKAYIKEKYNKPGNVYLGLVHRLDRNAGVSWFCKNLRRIRLSDQIRRRDCRTYLAVVHGCPENRREHLVNYLLKDRQETGSRLWNQAPREPSCAELYCSGEQGDLSLIQVELETEGPIESSPDGGINTLRGCQIPWSGKET